MTLPSKELLSEVLNVKVIKFEVCFVSSRINYLIDGNHVYNARR